MFGVVDYDMVYQYPFSGLGLGARILGEVKKEYTDILREADAIFIEELHNSNWYDKTSKAFAVFLPIKSVGVVGDARRYYERVIALPSPSLPITSLIRKLAISHARRPAQ